MRVCGQLGALAAVAIVALSCQGPPTRSEAADPAAATIPGMQVLRVGDPAPDFSLPGSDGNTYRLADYKGRQAVVLAWFAKAFTGP